MSDNDQKETTSPSSSESPPEITATGEDSGAPDEEELGISVGVENGHVIIVFTQRLTTVGLPPDAADTMAEALTRHAADARKMGT